MGEFGGMEKRLYPSGGWADLGGEEEGGKIVPWWGLGGFGEEGGGEMGEFREGGYRVVPWEGRGWVDLGVREVCWWYVNGFIVG